MFFGLEGKRLTVEAAEPIAVSSVISVEYEDSMFLGEVIACTQNEDGYHLEIKVEQILNGLQSLMALRARLLSEGATQPQSTQTGNLARTANYN